MSDLRLEMPSAPGLPIRREWVLVAVLFAIGLAVRLPYLMDVPRFSDEGQEVMVGLDIALGRRFPLNSGVILYFGPFFAYLTAAIIRIFGAHLELPRLTSAVVGAWMVVATYGLGRLVWNRTAALVAAGLAITDPALIVLGSHMGWSSSLTPLFATAALLSLYAGVTRNRGWLVAAGGLLAGISVQAHPTSGIILVGVALWLFTLPDLQPASKARFALIAAGLFAFGSAPSIITLAQARFAGQGITGLLAPSLAPGDYVPRLFSMLKIGGFFLGGGLGDATLALRVESILVELLLIVGSFVAWRPKSNLLPWVVVSSVVLLPILVEEFNERYYMFLFPTAFVIIGALVSAALTRANALALGAGWPSAAYRAARAAALVGLLGAVAVPLTTLAAFYASAESAGQTNAEYFRLVDVLRNQGACGSQLVVENTPKDFSTAVAIQSWYALHAADYVLTFDACPHVTATADRLGAVLSAPGNWWVVVSDRTARSLPLAGPDRVATIAAPPIETTLVPIQVYRVSSIQ